MNRKRAIVTTIGLLVALLLIFAPIIYVNINGKRERIVTNVHISFKHWFDVYSTQPIVMDFNSSRIVQFSSKADSGLLSLIIAEKGKMFFKGTLSAPGFDVAPMDSAIQPIGRENMWNYVLLPKRSGKQVALFDLQFGLTNDANAKDKALFQLWTNKVNDAMSKEVKLARFRGEFLVRHQAA